MRLINNGLRETMSSGKRYRVFRFDGQVTVAQSASDSEQTFIVDERRQ